MKLKTITYAVAIALAASAFVLGSPATSEAKGKKKVAAPPPQPLLCLYTYAPVCGSLKGHKFTYANTCAAYKDGATVVSSKPCPAKKK
jgi:hypothetical protein